MSHLQNHLPVKLIGNYILDEARNFTIESSRSAAKNSADRKQCVSRWRAQMAYDLQFGLFQADEGGPMWRGSFADLDMAKRKAQRLADEERQEFFVRRSEDRSEVARVFPSRTKPQSRPG